MTAYLFALCAGLAAALLTTAAIALDLWLSRLAETPPVHYGQPFSAKRSARLYRNPRQF